MEQRKLKLRVNIVPCSEGYYPEIWCPDTGKTIAELDPAVDGYDRWNKDHSRIQAGKWLRNYNKLFK